jgi:hypothetical protein
VNGAPRSATRNDYHEWQPRVGFAYRIGPNTVFRGGFGRFVQADLHLRQPEQFQPLHRLDRFQR